MIERTRKSGLLVAALAALGLSAALGACSKDPFADGAGKPIVIQTSRSLLNQKAGQSFQLTAQLMDDRLTPLVQVLAVTSANTGAVAIDSVTLDYTLARTVAFLRAPAVTKADSSTLTWTGAGLSATTKIVVTP